MQGSYGCMPPCMCEHDAQTKCTLPCGTVTYARAMTLCVRPSLSRTVRQLPVHPWCVWSVLVALRSVQGVPIAIVQLLSAAPGSKALSLCQYCGLASLAHQKCIIFGVHMVTWTTHDARSCHDTLANFIQQPVAWLCTFAVLFEGPGVSLLQLLSVHCVCVQLSTAEAVDCVNTVH